MYKVEMTQGGPSRDLGLWFHHRHHHQHNDAQTLGQQTLSSVAYFPAQSVFGT